MQNSPIYVIAAITDLYPSNDLYTIDSVQGVGWFSTFEEAENAIYNDAKNLPGFYQWYVIEETTPGFFSRVLSRTCYHWNQETQSYEKVPEPACLNDYPNLGLG